VCSLEDWLGDCRSVIFLLRIKLYFSMIKLR
jgi:hypothetical protein